MFILDMFGVNTHGDSCDLALRLLYSINFSSLRRHTERQQTCGQLPFSQNEAADL